ncbi:DAZ-associated protein 2 isoform X1 [Myotis lucifugus]|uniref:DAZ-associated protein 2 isoform X1 n=1 Tax=Myotis lucifugus TaxID=59463 RepID=UPI0006D73463|nr:DAZ-associated protein 2 isoform X1 [Myotis lucifugus]
MMGICRSKWGASTGIRAGQWGAGGGGAPRSGPQAGPGRNGSGRWGAGHRRRVTFPFPSRATITCPGSWDAASQYPTQPTYPVQPPGNPVYPQTLHLPQAPPYTDAPPAYSELYRPSFVHPGAATVPTMSAAFPGTSLYLPMAAQSVAVGPLGSTIPMAYYPVGPIYPPGSTVLVEGGYDAGARFGAGATAGNIPPPPPGCPPNAAQLAVMQGANVLVTQRKGNFFMGGTDGGYTIW